ncbi:MAG: MerR family transcriptional regulator, partial [Candidatus Acidiferrum sp.]
LYPDPVSSKDSTTRPLYCGKLARLSGVSAGTVRFYERRNLLLPAARTSAGYRVFSPDSLARMRMIRAGLSIGFSVTELADIFSEQSTFSASIFAGSTKSASNPKKKNLRQGERNPFNVVHDDLANHSR